MDCSRVFQQVTQLLMYKWTDNSICYYMPCMVFFLHLPQLPTICLSTRICRAYVGGEGLISNNSCPCQYVIVLISLIFVYIILQLNKLDCLAYVLFKGQKPGVGLSVWSRLMNIQNQITKCSQEAKPRVRLGILPSVLDSCKPSQL